MITNITLENFKCFRQVSINPKLLTVLIGPNGTGKSSILQALLLLKQSVTSGRINYRGEFFNLKNPTDLDAKFAPDSPVRLRIEGKRDGRQVLFSGPLHPNPIPGFTGDSEGSLLEIGLLLDSLKFVPAVRGLVRPAYSLGNKYEHHISLDQGLDALESQLATNLGYSRPIEETLSRLLEKITYTGLRAETVPPQSVEIKALSTGWSGQHCVGRIWHEYSDPIAPPTDSR